MSRALRTLVPAAGLLFAVAACGEPPGAAPAPRFAAGKADGACPTDATCLDWRRYDVVFTDPVCELYEYDVPIATTAGGERTSKPKDVYCKSALDAKNSGSRPESPQSRIVEWIETTAEGDAIFLASLSYSDTVIGAALCRAARDRGVAVTMVLDKPTARSKELEACGGTVLIRGHHGSVGFAHVKLIMINPAAPGPADEDGVYARLSFGSGNLSAGTHLHHENWSFLEVARDSYFYQANLCVLDALVDEDSTKGKTAFTNAIAACRAAITALPEDDIEVLFIPALADRKRAKEIMLEGAEDAQSLDIAAHRFSHSVLIEALETRLADADDDFRVRLVADDDLYWLSPLVGSSHELGPNTFYEAQRVSELSDAAAWSGDPERFSVRYMETNDKEFQLHHNKFIVMNDLPEGDGVLCGAANFTTSAYQDNLENVVWVRIPHVVDAYRAQFARFWDGTLDAEGQEIPGLATAPDDMPVTLQAP